MTVHIEINTIGAVTTLDKIADISKISAMEAMSKAGNKLRETARSNLRASSTAFWQIYRKSQKTGKLVRNIVKGKPHRFGNRISHGYNKAHGKLEDPKSMANFITSYLNEKSMVMVVAGKHKGYRPKTIKDGQIKGFQSRVNPTSAATHGILEKLETGETNKYSSNKLFSNSFRGRHFMQRARSSENGYINEMMGEMLAKMIQKQMDKMEAKAA